MVKTITYEWKDLDLRRVDQKPADGRLVLLKLTQKKPICKALAGPKYDVGRFEAHNGKTVWHGAGQGYYAAALKRVYAIRWCYAPEE